MNDKTTLPTQQAPRHTAVKYFFKKTLLLVAIILSISQFLEYVTPFHTGHELLSEKLKALKKEKANTLFIGTSHIYRGIDPFVFDANTAIPTHSYNLGMPRLAEPETTYLLENMKTEGYLEDIEYVLIEMTGVKSIIAENIHHTRSFYYQDAASFNLKMTYLIKKGLTLKSLEEVWAAVISRIQYLLQLNTISSYLSETLSSDFHDDISNSHRGFIPMDRQINRKNIKRVRDNFLASTGRFRNPTKEYQQILVASNLPKPTLEEKIIQHQIDKFKTWGIHPIFILMPRLKKQHYERGVPIFQQIDPQFKINLAIPDTEVDPNQADYAFDDTHLNEKGAVEVSKILAKRFNELLIRIENRQTPLQ